MYFFKYLMNRTEHPTDTNQYNTLPYFVWEKAIEDQSLLTFVNEYPFEWTPAEIGGVEPRIDKKIRNHDNAWIEYNEATDSLFEALHKPIESINFWHYNYVLWSMDDLQVGKFEKNSMYVMHNDRAVWPDRSERKLSVIMGLTSEDQYKGGEINLMTTGYPKHKQTVRLNRGDVLVFPTWVPYEIKPVEEGTMQLLSTWVYGPKFV